MNTLKKNFVINTWSTGNKVSVYYEPRCGGREQKLFDFKWWFAIYKKDLIKVKQILNNSKLKYKIGEFVSKHVLIYSEDLYNNSIKTQSRFDIVNLLESNGIETFEGDVMPDRKWYIQNSIEICTNLSKLYIDIETDDSDEKIEISKHRILSFAAITNTGKEVFICLDNLTDKAEKEMLYQIYEFMKGFDMILGWNSKEFDIPYIKERMKKYNIQTDIYYWKKFAHVDLLKRMRHIFRFDTGLRSFKLDFIAKHFLGHGKKDLGKKRIIETFKTDLLKLKEYNLEDARLCKQLDDKLNISDMIIKQSSWCGVPPAQFGLYSIVDAYILKNAHIHKKFGKTSIKAIDERRYDNERGNENPDNLLQYQKKERIAKYSGAIVLDAIPGKYENVYVFDFKSLYPSIIRTSNIGYDSLLCDPAMFSNAIKNPGTAEILRKSGKNEPTFFSKEPSVINITVSELMERRKEYKAKKLKMLELKETTGIEWEKTVSNENIVKELANSTYGIMGLEYGRYFSIDIAESITLFGQWILNSAKIYFNELGFNVIYGDTDSVFVATMGKKFDIIKELKNYHLFLEKKLLDYNIETSFIELEFDKLYRRFILIAKKSYIGHVINVENKKSNMIYARGIDYIKRNTFSFAAEKQKELSKLILMKNYDYDKTINWLDDVKKEFDKKTFSKKELTLSQKLNKKPDDYRKKTLDLHVRLAKERMNKTGERLVGSEIEYIVTGMNPNLIGIEASKFNGKYDKNYYWINKTRPVLKRIIGAAFPEHNKQLELFTI